MSRGTRREAARVPRQCRRRWPTALCALLLFGGCGGGTSTGDRPGGGSDTHEAPGDAAGDVGGAQDFGQQREALLGVAETHRRALSGLVDEVHVLRTEMNVPHIYAESREDLLRVYGYVVAQDRFFMMDLARRLGGGRLTELLGDAALPNDMESRGTGMTYVGERLLQHLTEEQERLADAFAAGINAYITAVVAGDAPAPTELDVAAPLLGAESPGELMKPFTRADITAMMAVVLYESSFETGDVGRAEGVARMEGHYDGVALEALRLQGAWEDIHGDVRPIKAIASAPGFGMNGTWAAGLTTAAQGLSSQQARPVAQVPTDLLGRLSDKLDRYQKRLLRDHEAGFGSNAWAVSSAHGEDGAAILAGDGHLQLSVPSILYQVGLDTEVFGGGDLHQLGLTIPGLVAMPIGTNGDVAWSQTQFGGDITDWYAEELTLDDAGRPDTSRIGEEWQPLTRIDESYEIAEVAVLGSVARTEQAARWVTAGGRWIVDIEGRPPTEEELASETAPVVHLLGTPWICEDENGDGVITAVSFDYVGLDMSGLLTFSDALGHATDVASFREACRGLTTYSQNLVAIDREGSILYTGYQPLPCRGYLSREADGSWSEGADPSQLIDGARFPGFSLPLATGVVDETLGAEFPEQCAVPFEAWPQTMDPPSGYVQTANNDPGGLSHDGSVTNDPYYLGGPWDVGFRADAIDRGLAAMVEDGPVTIEGMAALQGERRSSLGEHFTGLLLEAIDRGRSADPAGDDATVALGALYEGRAAAMDAVHERLTAWAARGYEANSGVETFYQSPSASERDDAIATMIFNAWFPRVIDGVFGDEALPGIWHGSGGRVRALDRLLHGRGAENPGALASWNADTGESAFFDTLGTEVVERSDAIILQALQDALAFLEGPGTGPGEGGFATQDMEAWLWGLRHQVRFESLLADFLGDDPMFSLLTDAFAIDTDVLPLAESIAAGDPRGALRWFPRDGDQYGVDAANPGFSGVRFTHSNGPVMRMVIALKQGRVSGQNIIPGGQSGLTDSEHFADQAALWLGNQTVPLRFHVEDVVAGATGREVFHPAQE